MMQTNHICITCGFCAPVSRFQPKTSSQARPKPPSDAQSKNVDSPGSPRLPRVQVGVSPTRSLGPNHHAPSCLGAAPPPSRCRPGLRPGHLCSGGVLSCGFNGRPRLWFSVPNPVTTTVLCPCISHRPAQPVHPMPPLRLAGPCSTGVPFPARHHHEMPVILRSPAISRHLLHPTRSHNSKEIR